MLAARQSAWPERATSTNRAATACRPPPVTPLAVAHGAPTVVNQWAATTSGTGTPLSRTIIPSFSSAPSFTFAPIQLDLETLNLSPTLTVTTLTNTARTCTDSGVVTILPFSSTAKYLGNRQCNVETSACNPNTEGVMVSCQCSSIPTAGQGAAWAVTSTKIEGGKCKCEVSLGCLTLRGLKRARHARLCALAAGVLSCRLRCYLTCRSPSLLPRLRCRPASPVLLSVLSALQVSRSRLRPSA